MRVEDRGGLVAVKEPGDEGKDILMPVPTKRKGKSKSNGQTSPQEVKAEDIGVSAQIPQQPQQQQTVVNPDELVFATETDIGEKQKELYHTLSGTDFQNVIRNFHTIYYHGHGLEIGKAQIGNPMTTAKWMGLSCGKCPMDMWVYQEILFETRPDLIIESGTAAGGSGLFLAQMCELMGTGNVVTVDINPPPFLRQHDRLVYMQGDIVSPEVVQVINKLKAECPHEPRVMFIFDDNHHADHVWEEMELYASWVSPGCYMIVEDTNINGNPVYPEFGPGPREAVLRFLENHPEFSVDFSRQKFLMSTNPGGYLRRL